jgi:subtilisin
MHRSALAWGLLALGLLLLPHASQAQSHVTRRIVVFSASTPPARRLTLAQATGATVVRELPLINAVVIETPSNTVTTAESRLTAMTEVARIDQDPRINWLAVADAPGIDFVMPNVRALLLNAARQKADAPAPPLPWGIARVHAPAAWKKSRGAGAKVCVIDTGIDRTHPDLAANVKGGWNAIAKSDDFTDDNGHGSHVSGTIAAVGDDTGVVGVAPKASLYGVKVLDAQGSGTFDDVIAGMQWAVDHKMQVVSMSLGASQGNQALADMVAAMTKAGVTLIAAAGNSGDSVGYPAAYPGAIAVAASDNNDQLADFSSRGPEVAVIAPGVDVKSTYMKGGYETLSGTSMATPHVSGLAALYVATHGRATPASIRVALAKASKKLPGIPDIGQGAGLPDAVSLTR